jgi:hypothetical protein
MMRALKLSPSVSDNLPTVQINKESPEEPYAE